MAIEYARTVCDSGDNSAITPIGIGNESFVVFIFAQTFILVPVSGTLFY